MLHARWVIYIYRIGLASLFVCDVWIVRRRRTVHAHTGSRPQKERDKHPGYAPVIRMAILPLPL